MSVMLLAFAYARYDCATSGEIVSRARISALFQLIGPALWW
jgi:hypothetical protein